MKALATVMFLATVNGLKYNITRKTGTASVGERNLKVGPPLGLLERMLISLQGMRLQSATSETVDVDNTHANMLYTMPVYLGSANQAFDVAIDTGGNKLVIMNSACTACSNTFNPTTSSTYVASTTMDNVNELDGSYVVGFKVTDRLSLDVANGYAVSNFNFLMGFTQSGFTTLEGLLGFPRTIDTSYDIFYQKLYDNSITPNT